MSSSQIADYERGKKDAERHRQATEHNWIRPTLSPFLWFGLPMVVLWVYMRRTGSSSAVGGKSRGNFFSDMMEEIMPLKKRQFRVDIKGTTFSDVIGIPEAKEDVRQYVEFLTNPNRYTRLGARLPKGCLLTGEPGTGKTLLAKAVAGEANVPFFSCNGADFIELLGGSGPKRVRELFEEARQAAPAIIFIDEVDAIGARVGKQGGSVSSEENRTINQLLAELDGLNTSADSIVVLAATNFQDNIDKALLREGRFDRKIAIEMPDLVARQDIFLHYLNRICTGDPKGRIVDGEGNALPINESISNAAMAQQLSYLTPGLSPATIATIVNEAALESGIAGKPLVDLQTILDAVDDTLMGRKHRKRQSAASARRTAVHEAGHAITAWMLPPSQAVLKVSITPRGHAMGYTQQASREFHDYQTNVTLFIDMVVLFGGRAAEEVLLGDTSAGAMDDLQRATDLALKKFLVFGMSLKVGLLSYRPEYTQAGRDFTTFSNKAQYQAELQAKELVRAAHDLATKLIQANRDKLNALVEELLKRDLTRPDLERLLGPRPQKPGVEELNQMLVEVYGN